MKTPLALTARPAAAAAALAGLALLATACGSSASPGAAPATTVTVTASPATSTATASPTQTPTPAPASTSPTPHASATGPQPCPTSALQASVGRGNAAAGSVYYPLRLANISHATCTLYGYPGLSFVTGVGGSQIGAAATHNATYPRRLVTLAPGATAHAAFQVADAQNYPGQDCHMVTAHWLKVYPPNQTTALYISFTAASCAKASAQVLTVQTMQPGKGAS